MTHFKAYVRSCGRGAVILLSFRTLGEGSCHLHIPQTGFQHINITNGNRVASSSFISFVFEGLTWTFQTYANLPMELQMEEIQIPRFSLSTAAISLRFPTKL